MPGERIAPRTLALPGSTSRGGMQPAVIVRARPTKPRRWRYCSLRTGNRRPVTASVDRTVPRRRSRSRDRGGVPPHPCERRFTRSGRDRLRIAGLRHARVGESASPRMAHHARRRDSNRIALAPEERCWDFASGSKATSWRAIFGSCWSPATSGFRDRGLDAGQAARLLVTAEAGWGRATYARSLGETQDVLRACSRRCGSSDGEPGLCRSEGRANRLLLDWITAVVRSVPEADTAAGAVALSDAVDGALAFLESAAATASAIDHLAASVLREAVGELHSLGSFRCSLPTALRFIRERAEGHSHWRRPSAAGAPVCVVPPALGHAGRPVAVHRRPRRGPSVPGSYRGSGPARLRAVRHLAGVAPVRGQDGRGGVLRVRRPRDFGCCDDVLLLLSGSAGISRDLPVLDAAAGVPDQVGRRVLSYPDLAQKRSVHRCLVRPVESHGRADGRRMVALAVEVGGRPGTKARAGAVPAAGARGSRCGAARGRRLHRVRRPRASRREGARPVSRRAARLSHAARSSSGVCIPAIPRTAGCGVNALDEVREGRRHLARSPHPRLGVARHVCRDAAPQQATPARVSKPTTDLAWLLERGTTRLQRASRRDAAAIRRGVRPRSREFLGDLELFVPEECDARPRARQSDSKSRSAIPSTRKERSSNSLRTTDRRRSRRGLKFNLAGRIDRIDRSASLVRGHRLQDRQLLREEMGDRCVRRRHATAARAVRPGGGRTAQPQHKKAKVVRRHLLLPQREGRQRASCDSHAAQRAKLASVLADLRDVIAAGTFVHAERRGMQVLRPGAACGAARARRPGRDKLQDGKLAARRRQLAHE